MFYYNVSGVMVKDGIKLNGDRKWSMHKIQAASTLHQARIMAKNNSGYYYVFRSVAGISVSIVWKHLTATMKIYIYTGIFSRSLQL